MNGFEIIEHTADVGVAAHGDTLEEAFRQATLGMLDIMGAWTPGEDEGEDVPIAVTARDRLALLVEWLGEVLYQHEVRDAVISEVEVGSVTETEARGRLSVHAREGALAGTAVKAITFHQLEVERDPEGWRIRVYVDI